MNILFFIKKTIHRKLLEDNIRKITSQLSGKFLDIGSKDARYIKWFHGEVIAIDTIENPQKGVGKGNIYKLMFPDQSFDVVLAFELFQYLDNPKKAISEVLRVLKPKGTLVLSIPMVYRVHDDLVRYTKIYLEKLLADFSEVKFLYAGNFYTIILDIIRDKIVRFPNRLLRLFCYLIFIVLTLLIPLSQKFSKDRNFVSGYLIVAKK